MKPLVIYGTGGHAAEIFGLIDAINTRQPTWDFAGFLVDLAYQAESELFGYPIFGDHCYLAANPETAIVIAIGSGHIRQTVVEKIERIVVNPNFPTLIHPTAMVSRLAKLGKGNQICAQSIIQPRAIIGDHVIINIACSISHDCTIGEFTTLAPGARLAGGVSIGNRTDIGIGAVVIPKVNIGSDCVVGAGAVMVRDIPDSVTAAGNPARLL